MHNQPVQSFGDAPSSTLIRAAGYAYFPIAFLARVPFAMNVVGVLTLVVAARGSIELGGFTSAAVGLGTALVGPLLGAAADRFGQRQVMLLAAIGNSLSLLLMAWIAFAAVADAWVLAVAVLVGATAPQVAPLSRTRLVSIIERRLPRARQERVLNATLAYESAADEIVFVFGPVIVGLLATTLHPAAPIIGAAALTFVFVLAFALHRSANTVQPHALRGEIVQAPARDLARLRVLILVAGMLGIGFFFGSTLTALTAFMADRGNGAQAGLLYGVMGVGSAILALSAAAFSPRFLLGARWLVFASVLLTGALLIAAAHDISSMLLALALSGIGIGPLIVTIYTIAAKRTPIGRSATLMTMVGAGVTVGQASSSAVVGMIAENVGTSAALWGSAASAAVVLTCGAVNWALPRSERV